VTSQLLPDTQRLVANKANGQLIQNGERHFRLYFSKDEKENEYVSLLTATIDVYESVAGFFVFQRPRKSLKHGKKRAGESRFIVSRLV